MASMEQRRVSILNIDRGALLEEVSVQLEKVAENLLDPNCEHKPARGLTVQLTFTTDERREITK